MAVRNMRCLVFAFAMTIIFLLAPSNADSSSGSKCGGHEALVQLFNVTVPCDKFIDKNNTRQEGNADPPAACCDAIKRADMACLCANIPKVFEMYASMDSFVFAAGKCNPQSLKPISNCGTYSVRWSDRGAYATKELKGRNMKE